MQRIPLRVSYVSTVLCLKAEDDPSGKTNLLGVGCVEVPLPPGKSSVSLHAVLYVQWIAIERRPGSVQARLLLLDAQHRLTHSMPFEFAEFARGTDVLAQPVPVDLNVSASPIFLCIEVDGEVQTAMPVVGRPSAAQEERP